MIYIQIDEQGTVMFQHNMPFHEKHGLGKTQSELEAEGYFFDSIPEPEQIAGKSGVLKYSETDGLYYEYVSMPPTQEDLYEQQMDYLVDLDFRLLQIELGF